MAIRVDLTGQDAITEVRRQGREIEAFYNVFVVMEFDHTFSKNIGQ